MRDRAKNFMIEPTLPHDVRESLEQLYCRGEHTVISVHSSNAYCQSLSWDRILKYMDRKLFQRMISIDFPPLFYSMTQNENFYLFANYNPDDDNPMARIQMIKAAIQKRHDDLDKHIKTQKEKSQQILVKLDIHIKTQKDVIDGMLEECCQLQIHVMKLDKLLSSESCFKHIPRDIINIVRSYLHFV